MARLFPLVLIVQIFCLYHAFTNRADYKWILFIFIFPIIGGGIYLYHHFYSRENVKVVSESVKGVINPNYDLEKLQNELKFSDSIQNRSKLADKYFEQERFEEAIELYESCLSGFNKSNVALRIRLLQCYASTANYDRAIEIGAELEDEALFRKSFARVDYAWSLHHTDDDQSARSTFEALNTSYSNYEHRLEYVKYLNKMESRDEAISLLEEMKEEFNQMDSTERRATSAERRAVTSAYDRLKRS